MSEWETIKPADDGWETITPAKQPPEEPGWGSIIKRVQQASASILAGKLNPVGDAIVSLGTGALATANSGLVGLAGSVLPGPEGQGADWARQTQEAMTYQPKTPEGRSAVDAISYLPGKVAEGLDWAGGETAEATGSPAIGTAVPVAANAALLALGGRGAKPLPKPVAEAFDAGFQLTPTQAGRGQVPRALEGLSGQAKMEKLLSVKNSSTVNKWVKEDFGLPQDKPITVEALEEIRKESGKAYEAVKSSVKLIKPDAKFTADVAKLRGDYSEAVKAYPGIVKNSDVEVLINELNVAASPRAMVELTRKLRHDGSANLKAFDDPGKQELGFAQRNAASSLERLIDRALTSVGKKDLVSQWKSARRTIAKTYDTQAVLNETTGDVSAIQLGRMLKKGDPLDGGMLKAAKFARAFEGSARDVGKMRDSTQLSYGDALMGMIASGGTGGAFGGGQGALVGLAAAGGALLARPTLRQLMIQRGKPLPLERSVGLLPIIKESEE